MRKFWKTQGNKHSQEGRWPKWSPRESRWSHRGQDNHWLECLDQPVRLALKFSRRLTGLTVEKVGAKVFMHLLLNFQHEQKVSLSTQLSTGTLSMVLRSSLSFASPSNQGAPSRGSFVQPRTSSKGEVTQHLLCAGFKEPGRSGGVSALSFLAVSTRTRDLPTRVHCPQV